jgi:threonine/homoserine/homoserine lactone efflux protein
MMNESAGASAVKVAGLATGAAMSGMDSVTQAVGTHGQEIVWFLTVAYGVLQIVKSMPWLSMQSIAFYRGVRYRDWAAWRAIANREDREKDEQQ